MNVLANLFRGVRRDRAGVRLFFRDPVLGQKVNDRLGLDLQLPGQLVNSDLVCLAHALRSVLGLRPFRLFQITFGLDWRFLRRRLIHCCFFSFFA